MRGGAVYILYICKLEYDFIDQIDQQYGDLQNRYPGKEDIQAGDQTSNFCMKCANPFDFWKYVLFSHFELLYMQETLDKQVTFQHL